MDDAEACFILSNRFEVDRIAAVCYFPVLLQNIHVRLHVLNKTDG